MRTATSIEDDLVKQAAARGVILELDGNSWCAHRADFVNLQESPAGFGNTPRDALRNLIVCIARDEHTRELRKLMQTRDFAALLESPRLR